MVIFAHQTNLNTNKIIIIRIFLTIFKKIINKVKNCQKVNNTLKDINNYINIYLKRVNTKWGFAVVPQPNLILLSLVSI